MITSNVPALLEMQGIVKKFSGTCAVNGADFDCRSGEIHCLVGENGAGKSTLVKVLVGVHTPDDGKIIFKGKEVKFTNYSEARASGIGVVYQDLSLLPELTVAENIAMGVWPTNKIGLIRWDQIRAISNEILQSMGISINPDLLVSSLPVALRQMVEIAKVVVQKPDLIIFDEPTAPLSHDEVNVLFKLISDLKTQGKAIIFISHRLEEVLTISDRITVMKDGKKVVTDLTSTFTRQKLITSMVGREISDIFPKKCAQLESAPEIFSYESVLNRSNSRVAFTLHRGEVLGIGGLQGQGQMELLKSIFGLGYCRDLQVKIDDEVCTFNNPRQAMARGVALVPENRNEEGIFLILSIIANLASTTLSRRQKAGFVEKNKEVKAVAGIIKQLSIKVSSYHQTAQSLSGGNMQKLVLGKWLLFNPKLIVLLEPTKGVDVGTKQQIYRLIREMADSGVGVIINTSDMVELIGLCDRILVMNHGFLTAGLRGDEITEEKIMEASVGNKNMISAENDL